jgi:hypothetical protein
MSLHLAAGRKIQVQNKQKNRAKGDGGWNEEMKDGHSFRKKLLCKDFWQVSETKTQHGK